MTDFELVDAVASHAALFITFFMAFISATSALLVVAHVAAEKMPVALVRVVIAIYTVTSLFVIGCFQRLTQVALGIQGQMGESLNWQTRRIGFCQC